MNDGTLPTDRLALATVNASLRDHVSGDDLEGWLRAETPSDGATVVLTLLFTECPADALARFLAGRRISIDEARSAATRFVRPFLGTDEPMPIDEMALEA